MAQESKKEIWRWDWHDMEGGVIGYTFRYESESGAKEVIPYFVQNGNGFKAGAPSKPYPLFDCHRFPLGASEETIFVVEGEKCSRALTSCGLNCTTSLGGAMQADKSDWNPLKDYKSFVLLSDNDEPGRRYMSDVARILSEQNPTALIRLIPKVTDNECGDVVDLIQSIVSGWNGYDPVPEDSHKLVKARILAVSENAPKYEPLFVDVWDEPLPISSFREHQWPREALPSRIAPFIEQLSFDTETPIELAISACLSALTAAMRGVYWVQVKQEWSEPVSLWTMCILESGQMKSAVASMANEPITSWEAEKFEGAERDAVEAKRSNELVNLRISELKKSYARTKDPVKRPLIREEIRELENQLLPEPVAPSLWTADATPEAVAVKLKQNGGSCAVLSDEGGVLETLSGGYGKGRGNIVPLLQGYSGSDIRIDRIMREAIYVRRGVISLGVMTQPTVLSGLDPKKRDDLRGTGFFARFLYFVPTMRSTPRLFVTPTLTTSAKDSYHSVVRELLNHSTSVREQGAAPVYLTFSPDAFNFFESHYREIEKEKIEGGRLENFKDWHEKHRGNLARFVSWYHLVEHGPDKAVKTPISIETVRKVTSLSSLFVEHCLRAHGVLGLNPLIEKANKVLEWIVRDNKREFLLRDMYRDNHRTVRTPKEARRIISYLEEKRIVRSHPQSTNPRSIRVQVNPKMFEE